MIIVWLIRSYWIGQVCPQTVRPRTIWQRTACVAAPDPVCLSRITIWQHSHTTLRWKQFQSNCHSWKNTRNIFTPTKKDWQQLSFQFTFVVGSREQEQGKQQTHLELDLPPGSVRKTSPADLMDLIASVNRAGMCLEVRLTSEFILYCAEG